MNHYQPKVKYRKPQYDRLIYIKRKHQLGVTLSRGEVWEFISLSWRKWTRKV